MLPIPCHAFGITAALQWYGLNDRQEINSYGTLRPTSKTFLSDFPDIAKLKRVIYREALTRKRDAYDEIGTSAEEQRITERTRQGLAVFTAAMTSMPAAKRQQIVADALSQHEADWPLEDAIGLMTGSVDEPSEDDVAKLIREEEDFKSVRACPRACKHACCMLPPVEYARVVFTIPVVSVVVESLFSVMNYTKGKHRARHSDEGVAATIHIKECDSVISNGSGPLPEGLHLNQERFLLHDMRDAGFHPPTLPDNLRPVRQRSGPEAG